MTAYNGVWMALLAAGGPNNEPPVCFVGGRVRVFCEHFQYNTQVAGSTLNLGVFPAGALILGFEIITDTSTATATIALGDGTTANRFMAATAFTTTDVPVPVGKTANAISTAQLTARTTLVGTTATASLPASGNLVVQTYYTLD